MKSAKQILDESLRVYKPSTIILSFSGGYDSMVSSHIGAKWAKYHAHSANVITVSADTTISADGWRNFVTSTAKALSLPRFSIRNTTHFDEWSKRMINKGYTYRKSQHKINFYYLKQVVFRALIQEYKKHRTDRIMFINGVRRAESSDRQSTPEHTRQGSGVFVNPIVYWTDEQVTAYRYKYNMPENPFYETVGNSGDCLCNWHTQNSLDDLRQHSPATAQRIEPIHNGCKAKWGYGYGETPRNGTFTEGAGVQMSLFDLKGSDETPNLCTGCTRPEPSNTTYADVFLSRYDWHK